jgi:hypothetical protein
MRQNASTRSLQKTANLPCSSSTLSCNHNRFKKGNPISPVSHGKSDFEDSSQKINVYFFFFTSVLINSGRY